MTGHELSDLSNEISVSSFVPPARGWFFHLDGFVHQHETERRSWGTKAKSWKYNSNESR